MVAYLTDDKCWIQWKRSEKLCELSGLEYLHNPCTQLDARLHPGDCTQKWDPYLMKKTLWPNFRQVIIAMLSGGAVGQFFEPAPRRGTKLKYASGARRRNSRVFAFPCILGPPTQPSSIFLRVWPSSVRRVSKSTLWLGSSLATSYLNNLMVAYLTDAGCWLQWKRNERLRELAGLEYIGNPCAQLDAQLHLGLDP